MSYGLATGKTTNGNNHGGNLYLYDFCRLARALESLGLRTSFRRTSATNNKRSYSSNIFLSLASYRTKARAMANRTASAWPLIPPLETVTERLIFRAKSPARVN